MNKGIFTVAVCADVRPKTYSMVIALSSILRFFSARSDGLPTATIDSGCTMIGIFPDNLLSCADEAGEAQLLSYQEFIGE
jgi:hypothetical protein